MLFKNLFVAALCAIQASAAVITPQVKESSHALEPSAILVSRADKLIEAGAETGTINDSIYTHGLATCPGIVASGKHKKKDGVTKVLAHVRCGNFKNHLDDWVNKVHASGMTDIKVLIYILDHTKVDKGLQATQKMINDYAKSSAMKVKSGYAVATRTDPAAPSPQDKLRVDKAGAIYVADKKAL
ncbi:hypothetical protein VHEMI08276 [[Torrubiella] hemipterigena]|uniref:Uncharacterized protein n=1 Tax=[Torrubiella] hemipterigena TaxID=1531966 RepID=A0A0A1TN73_9HYPO|nr:hypothetical protein VHEMI08276 [[Torrubiella] hemipterigena]